MRRSLPVLRIALVLLLVGLVWHRCGEESGERLAEPVGTRGEEGEATTLRARASRPSKASAPSAGAAQRRTASESGGESLDPPEPGPAASFTLATVDGRGLPLGGAELRVIPLEGDTGVTFAPRTDARGRALIGVAVPTRLEVVARSGGRAGRTVVGPELPETLRLELVPALDFGVRVVDRAGSPIAGLRLFLREVADGPGETVPAEIGLRVHGPPLPERKPSITSTDAEGRARFVVARDLWDHAPGALVEVVVDLVGRERPTLRVAVEDLLQREDDLEIAIDRPRRWGFRAAIADRAGEDGRGDLRIAWRIGGELVDPDMADDRVGLAPGEIFYLHAGAGPTELRAELLVSAPGHETVRHREVPIDFRTEGVLDLCRGPALVTLRMRIVDGEGRPCAAEIEVLPPVDHDPAALVFDLETELEGVGQDAKRRRRRAGADGRLGFSIPASWGRPRLRARTGGLRLPRGVPALEPGADLDLGDLVHDAGPLAVSGRVVDAAGAPVAGARVRLLSRDSYRDWELRSDASGHFALETDPDMDDGQPLRLAVFAEGFLAARPPEVAFGRRDLTVTLQRSAGCRGILAFANPLLRREMACEVLDATTGELITTVHPDLDGHFLTERLRPGDCILRVRWDRDPEGERAETFAFRARAGAIHDLGRREVARDYERSYVRIETPEGRPDPYASFTLREEGGALAIRDDLMPAGELPLNLPKGRTWTLEADSIGRSTIIRRGLRPPFVLRFPPKER